MHRQMDEFMLRIKKENITTITRGSLLYRILKQVVK
jgi:hypothetical protein